MIHYVKGNILESDAQALVNTVNTVGVMGKGLALQFREAFPENYRIYRQACKDKDFKVGQMLVVQDSNPVYGDKIIVNFPTKTNWRLPSEYVYIEQGLKTLRYEIETRGIKSIAIPALGSHNGGLDWMRVKPMVEQALADMDCDIYLYEPSEAIVHKMKTERAKLTPARAMLLVMFADMVRQGEFASVFAAEKLIYFMQCFGARNIFKIDYRPYYYGPYSGGKVAHVLYALNGSYIEGMTAMDNRPFDYVWIFADTESEAYKFLDDYEDGARCKDICEHTKVFLSGYYSNYTLELLSSVHYLLNNAPELAGWRTMADETVLSHLAGEIQRWSARKEKLFKQEYLAIAYNYLKHADI